MTTTDNTAANQGELTALRLPDLRKIAADLGLKGTSALRKGDLINAISAAREGKPTAAAKKTSPRKAPSRTRATQPSAPVEQAQEAPAQTSTAPASAPSEETPAAPLVVDVAV